MSADGFAFQSVCYTDTSALDAAWASQYPMPQGAEVWRLTSFSSSSVSGHTISYTLQQSIRSGSVSSSVVMPACDSSVMVNQHLLHQIFDVPSPDDYTVAYAAGFMPIMLIFLGSLGIRYVLELIGWMDPN